MRIEIHLIVPDHLGGVLAKTSEKACVGDLAMKSVSATGTPTTSVPRRMLARIPLNKHCRAHPCE